MTEYELSILGQAISILSKLKLTGEVESASGQEEQVSAFMEILLNLPLPRNKALFCSDIYEVFKLGGIELSPFHILSPQHRNESVRCLGEILSRCSRHIFTNGAENLLQKGSKGGKTTYKVVFK